MAVSSATAARSSCSAQYTCLSFVWEKKHWLMLLSFFHRFTHLRWWIWIKIGIFIERVSVKSYFIFFCYKGSGTRTAIRIEMFILTEALERRPVEIHTQNDYFVLFESDELLFKIQKIESINADFQFGHPLQYFYMQLQHIASFHSE